MVALSKQAGSVKTPKNGKRILVVEDDLELQELVKDALEHHGFTVDAADDGLDALVALRTGAPPDAILLDLMMPGMDGFEFRTRQLTDAVLARIPVVVSSCVGEKAITKMSGVAAILRKPYRLDDLVSTLSQVCDLRGT